MQTELLYQLALSQVPGIGYARAKALALQFGEAHAIFSAKISTLEKVEGISPAVARSVRHFKAFAPLEKELAFIEKYKIRTAFLTDTDYPQRLLHCFDSPTLLFYKGAADLNAPRMAAIVGTRTCTDYGRTVTEGLVQQLAAEGVTILSGLAYGIDAVAHKAALKNGATTIGVVGHGLDKMYPPDHAGLAKEMIASGGSVLTEFLSTAKADKFNFPLRNRIVAGLADVTVVVETEVKGGSMITAKLANAYNRDVFAVPGRTIDKKSTGCNDLIQYNKAALLTSGADLLTAMGWSSQKKSTKAKIQKALFIELTPTEKAIVSLLNEVETLAIDELNLRLSDSTSAVAAALLNLELQGVVASLPGKQYRLV